MAELERNIIPYGEQNFATVRKGGLYYVDKTPYIRELELRSSKVFFVRPRRMGKSLFVDMLARYYDLAEKDSFRELFGDLAIGKRPTEGANSYYVLKLDFSKVNSCRGTTLEERFNGYLTIATRAFLDHYRPFFEEDLCRTIDASIGTDALSYLYQDFNQIACEEIDPLTDFSKM